MAACGSYRADESLMGWTEGGIESRWRTFPQEVETPIELRRREDVLELVSTNAPAACLKLNPSMWRGGYSFEWLSEAFGCNTTITRLEMDGVKLTLNGVRWLCESLRENTTLRHLNLWDDSIHAAGVKELTAALRHNSSLTSLDLCWNSIQDGGAAELAALLATNSPVAFLNLSHNAIKVGGAVRLGSALERNSTLVHLDLSGNSVGGAWVGNLLRNNSSLTDLQLEKCLIRDEEVAELAEGLRWNTSLAFLNIAANEIERDGTLMLADALRYGQTLVGLDLSSNKLDGETAVAVLEASSALTTLRLHDVGLDDRGLCMVAEALKRNTTLTSLDVRSKSGGNVGMLSLARALECNSTLTELGVGGFYHVESGAVESLGGALRVNDTLRSLVVHARRVNCADAFAEALRINTSLMLLRVFREEREDDAQRHALAAAIEENPTLTSVKVGAWGCEFLPSCERNIANQACKSITLLQLLLESRSSPLFRVKTRLE